MTVSIITVVYNRENVIANAVHSVNSQSYEDIEHVVIDGASTDKTLKILKQCLSPTAILISEPDKGIYDAFNKGLSMSTGEVIGFLHSDDVYLNNSVLSEVMSYFKDPSIDVVYGDVSFFREKNPEKNLRTYKSGKFSSRRLSWGWMPAQPSTFIRKRVYEKYGNYKTDYQIASDFDFLCRIMADDNLKYEYISKILVKMGLGGISTSGIKSTIIINREVLRACKENDIPSNIFKILSKYPFKLLEFF